MNRNRTDQELEQALDRAGERIRTSELGATDTAAAAARVRERLRAATSDQAPLLGGCVAYRQQMPAAQRGELSAARALLIEQHTRECVACRREWKALRDGRGANPAARVAADRGQWTFWIAAAAALLILGLGGYIAQSRLLAPPTRMASVLQADGGLFRIRSEATLPIVAQQAIAYGEGIRTAKNGGAVLRLADGTRVEMRERTELALAASGRDTDIRLVRGAIIVQAAEQGAGHLYVTTNDCRVAVKGTIFSVDQGTKGARVSVLKGKVHVESKTGGGEALLTPGKQFASNASVGLTPLATEIAWSRDRAQYDAVLAELTGLQHDLDQLPGPAPRRSTRLLDLVPANTIVYAAVPNVSGTVSEAHRLLSDRLRNSEPLRAWWTERVGDRGQAELDTAIEKLRQLGDQLGDEIVVALPGADAGATSPIAGVLVLATVKDPARFRTLVEEELAQVKTKGDHGPDVRFVDDLSTAPVPAGKDTLELWLNGDLVAAASNRSLLVDVAARTAANAAPVAATPFHERLARAYGNGVVWLAAADLGRIFETTTAKDSGTHETLRRSGLLDARYLFVQGTGDGKNVSFEASLDFAGPRHGVASWLAAPAPMGSLAFVSPDATAVAAVVVKDPTALLDDVFEMLGDRAPDARAKLAEASAELGVDVRQDVLATLGGEIAVALDGPVLPTPAWKAVVEVYDPAKLQQALEAIVRAANAKLAGRTDAPKLELELTHEELAGRTYYSIGAKDAVHVAYTYADGYLLVAPTRALIERTLQNRRAGLSITGAPNFRALLPADREANFSAIFYRDTASLFHAIGQNPAAPQDGGAKNPIAALFSAARPGLEYAYGADDRITLAASGGRLSGLELMSLLGMSSAHGNPQAAPTTGANGS